ncbi:FG-GAP-like repeat-containing protein [candidate division KSB1 bacterium]|nr:FG-GAP-like repeat-containing protein [candidate division KSB1 bacterium]
MIKSSKIFDLIIGSFLIFLFAILMMPAFGLENTSGQKRPNHSIFTHFTDVSRYANVAHTGKSVSAIWLDFNDDGWLDLFVCNGYNQPNVLYRNVKNGTFEDVTAKASLVDFRWSHAAHWLDFDDDGNFELCVENKLGNQIFRKTDQDSFVNITNSFSFLNNSGLTWADFNNDGLLDVHICRSDGNVSREGSPPNQLFKNLGNGQFKEMAGQAGVVGEGDSQCASWIDFNNDGYLDLHVIDGNKQPDHLYKNNQNETFTDVINQSGIDEHNGSAYWADFNNDGWIDLFIAEENQARLYKNHGDGKFTDITATTGIFFPANTSLLANWVDFDNDGDLDLFFLSTIDLYNSNPALYKNNGNETFTDITHELGLDIITSAYQSIWADYDNDGDPDLYLPSKGANLLYRNDGGNNHWIKIRLIPGITNRAAIGTSITVVSGSLRQQSQVGIAAHARYFSQTILFGIGQHTIIDSIIVRWPTDMVQDTTNIAVNREVMIHEINPPLFSDVSIESGIGLDTAKSTGAAFIDFDHDGWLDLLVGQQPPVLYRNNSAGKFIHASQQAQLDYNVCTFGIGYSDFNNDGNTDLYLANAIYTPNLLLKSLGDGTFADVTQLADVGGGAICSDDLALGDFNNDGKLDIYVGNEGANVLYFNQGDFRFVDVTRQAGVGDTLISNCTAADYDNDGDLDIYVANNRGGYDDYPIKDRWPNRLYRNNGDGTFTDVAAQAGVRDESNSKGCCFGDYDNDGDLDLYVGNDGSPNRLFCNNADGTFSDVTDQAGVAEPIGTQGVVFADFDNDGYLDIYAAGGSYIPELHKYCVQKDHPDMLYHNNGDGTFTDITQSAGINSNNPCTYGITIGDYDNDGDLDIFLANSIFKGSYESASVLLKNNSNKNHWLHLKLIGRKSNRSAIGARVKLIAGDLAQIREVEGGHGCGSQNSLPVEFGLGKRDVSDELIIRWPSRVIQHKKNVPIDRLLIVEDPYQLGRLQFSAAMIRFIKVGLLALIGIALFTSFFLIVALPAFKKYHRASQRKAALPGALSTAAAAPAVELPQDEVLTINIKLVQFRDEHLATYSVTSNFPTSKTLLAMVDRTQEKTPYPIKDIKIQRLQQKIEQLWKSYAQYVVTGQQSATKPLVLLQDIGEKIYQYFGLTGLFKALFSLTEVHVNFMLDSAIIPWHWVFHPEAGKFLCEKFPMGMTFVKTKKGVEQDAFKQKLRGQVEQSSAPTAVLFYGDWKGHARELKQVANEIHEIKAILERKRFQVVTIYQDCDRFAETIQEIYQEGKNLRVIHYSGHIENNMLALAEDEYFVVSFLKQAYGLSLASRPIIFFNGCRSGQLEESWQKHESLATEFLDCGASACIVTQFQVPELSAKNFALRFYHYFINEGLTVGQSLRQTRLDLAKPECAVGGDSEYDITRYFYNLYGDAMVKLGN